MGTMVDSWKLATISMWVDNLAHSEVIKLIENTFTWDDLWEAAVEVYQLCAARDMATKIPRNRDLGVEKNRVAILGSNLVASLQELKGKDDRPIFVVSSSNLYQVPGVIKDTVQADPAVTARLSSIEKMVENLSKGFKEIKAAQPSQWPSLQVNGEPLQGGGGQGGQHLGTRNRGGSVTAGFRARSPSLKRSAEDAQITEVYTPVPAQQSAWSEVVKKNQGRKQRPVQHGIAKVNVVGGEAAPYDVVIGNTNPGSTKEIIIEVLQKVALQVSEEFKPEEPLEVLEVECLTKPRDDGRRIWVKTWRVQVPNKFKEYMERPEAYPSGWTARKYFPPKAPRPPVPDLVPTAAQPPVKRANVGGPPHLIN